MPRDLVLRVVADLHHVGGLLAAHRDRAGGRQPLGLGRAERDTFLAPPELGEPARVHRTVAGPVITMKRNDVGPLERLGRALGAGRHEVHGGPVDVEDLGGGALLGLSHGDLLAGEDLGDLGLGIVHVPGDDRVGRADDGAGGFEAHVEAVGAVVALRGGVRLRVDVDRVVGAGLHAGLAPDAGILVELHDPVVALIHRPGRTDPHARRVRAVVAAGDLEVPLVVRVGPGLGVLHPGAVDAEGDLVLALARRGARVAADAGAIVDDEAVVHCAALAASRRPQFWFAGTLTSMRFGGDSFRSSMMATNSSALLPPPRRGLCFFSSPTVLDVRPL